MPNLTDVLNGEDENTIYENAKEVCIPYEGGVLPTNAILDFTTSDTETGGLKWTAPNGAWYSRASHGTGYIFDFNGSIKFEIYEDSGRLSLRTNDLYWSNNQVLVSNPNVNGSSAVTNIMSLTQTAYDGIVTPSPTTLYIITGP